jgi:hypothetical protein
MTTIPGSATADYLSTGELLGVGAGSVLIFGAGNFVKQKNADAPARWVKPLGIDLKISRLLGGEAGIERQNIVDSRLGSAMTTLGTGLILGLTDWHHPRSDRSKDVWQDQYVYFSGTLATKGVTDFFKGVVSRQRPLLSIEPELAATRPDPDHAHDHQSFFSGHASSAFYAMTFLNLRIRDVMRREMDPDDYRGRRWIPSTLCFGWASYVAFSRVQAYQHYFTDVLAGALVGYLFGELFYSMADNTASEDKGSDASTPLYFQIRVGF